MKAPVTPRNYCYDEIAKRVHAAAVRRFYRAALKALPEFVPAGAVHFNPGGIAVWGEVHLKLSRNGGGPVVEAYNTSQGMLVRQWNGHNSGRNHYAADLETFVTLVRQLSAAPFVRF